MEARSRKTYDQGGEFVIINFRENEIKALINQRWMNHFTN